MSYRRTSLALKVQRDDILYERIQDIVEPFMRAVYEGDLDKSADFAKSHKDYRTGRQHQPTIAECITEAFEYEGMDISDVFAIMVKVAQGQCPQDDAVALIKHLTYTYAQNNIDERIDFEDLYPSDFL